MKPTLCIIGGCNGAGAASAHGHSTVFECRRDGAGLSPLDPTLSAFRAGRLLIEESRTMMESGSSYAIESTLSGKTYVAMLQKAKECDYRIVLHYILLDSADQAVQRVALRVTHGGHHVPEADVRRRFERGRKHFLEDYVPLADEWELWNNTQPPPRRMAGSRTHNLEQLKAMLDSSKIQETPTHEISEMERLGLEAGRRATEKMLDFYKRMGIRVTPQMTLAPEPKKRVRKPKPQA